MYHAFVRIDGVWRSFGLHTPSNAWSDYFKTLRRAFGEENVAYTFWPHDDALSRVEDVQRRARQDVHFANETQRRYDVDGRFAVVDGQMNISAGITLLREEREAAQAVAR